MSVFRQIYCTFIISAVCMNLGIMFGWPSSRIKLFSSTNTTLNRVMTDTEISLFGSLSCIAALVGTPLSGMLLDLLGRKYICILFSLPQVIAWTLVTFLPRVEAILFAVFISGLGGCSFMVAPIFISELSQENIRGSLTSCSNIFSGIGLMVSYLLGGYLSYDMMNYVCLTTSIACLALLSLVKETPVHLMKKGLDKEAIRSICFYRSAKPNSKIVLREMEQLRRILNPSLEDVTPEENPLKSEESLKPKQLSKLQFIKHSKSTRRGFVVVLLLLSLSIFQGIIVVQVYAEPLFQETLPNVSANLASIIFALVTIISGFTGAFLIDIFGRRSVMIYPSLVAAVTSAALGAQLQFRWGPSWLTAVLMFSYCVLLAGSSSVVPFVMVSELFLPEVRGIMTMLVIEWGWILNFLILFIFNPLVVAVGLGPLFYVFAVVCLLSTIYTVLYVPETKGLSVDVIQTVLLKGKQY